MLKSRDILIYFALKYCGNWRLMYDAITRKEKFSTTDVIDANNTLTSKAITILDDDYPSFLKKIYCPPFVLFYHGDISLINEELMKIAVVGSRDCSEYGVKMTDSLVSGICRELIVVSGLACGIDAVAHQTAISNGGKTIAILGSGINYCYPDTNIYLYKEIKENHLVLSEYPHLTPPTKESFPFRNRIIAALGDATLVTEAHLKSGTMITTSFALTFGRDVMCVPARADDDSACNKLIKEGAILVEDCDDIRRNMKTKILKKS